ncbi:MAG: NAD(P)/FAD-dependent oxidoreductase [Acidimicrobiales bacterium]|nr:NAD(P)/FAD-dependent oxidoreductase [Acidimicrobiales bacterium]
MSDEAVARLERRARQELELLAYPAREWVQPRCGPDGRPATDVVVVGGAQCGIAIAFGLRRAGVTNVAVLDAAPAGREGPWRTIARMNELRTPKHQVGVEHGIPSLTAPAWYRARHGEAAWASIERIGRDDWADYLDWLRDQAGIDVCNGAQVTGLEPVQGDDGLVALLVRGVHRPGSSSSDRGDRRLYARHVVLATGFTGGGLWYTPEHIAEVVPPTLRHHACEGYDADEHRGLRVGVLGHGASAFDAAAAVLDAGAASVALCFRRPELPMVNPHRAVEYHGFLGCFADLDDDVRWDVARYFDGADQPPAPDGFRRAHRHRNLAVHAGAPWEEVRLEGPAGPIRVRTPHGTFTWDRIICATGARIDLGARPELAVLEPHIARWGDRYRPPAGREHDGLARAPYLGPGFELLPRGAGAPGCLSRLYAFNSSCYVSQGPHSTSISGLKFAAPRVVSAIVRSLLRDQQHGLVASLAEFREPERLFAEVPAP